MESGVLCPLRQSEPTEGPPGGHQEGGECEETALSDGDGSSLDWSDIRPQDVADNFLKLVSLATGRGSATTATIDSIRTRGVVADHRAEGPRQAGHVPSLEAYAASSSHVPPRLQPPFNGESRSSRHVEKSVAKVAPPGCHRTLTIGMKPQLIDLDELASQGDDRTTLMIKSVPRKYLPADATKDANRGYAFINLKSAEYLYIFARLFQNHEWLHYNTARRSCQLFFAHIQGREDTIKHLNQERHPLYMLQRRRRGTTALPITTQYLTMDPLEVWGVQDLSLLAAAAGAGDVINSAAPLRSDTAHGLY
ncbi:hypothetical protein FOL47_004386 [Perkinsus chesapeaki]|uniref:Mei2-like C-terminal RNA recognition motif domain-containing protein n=1 Tax=Perkinsus chesapeaki TaxID=330153 RepID=A0A7J6MZX3_PERCH|nr:hypothetical protein FOL47_004386 [Perkinsus chesapeaki]